MKKILLSVLSIGAVAIVAVIATNAYFSDEEKSVGNTFTAGRLDLKIDSTAHYAGLVCAYYDPDEAGTTYQPGYYWNAKGKPTTRPDLVDQPCDGSWEAKDLTGKKFFNLADIKPGDSGENTISLLVKDNPSYMCVTIDKMVDSENGCTEPECIAENGTWDGTVCTGMPVDHCANPGPGKGELSKEIHFFAWAENDGNNVWNTGELKLFSNTEGPASDVIDGVVYPMYTPQLNAGATFPANQTKYIGLYWCYGTLKVDEPSNTLTCDGKGGTNLTQTDSLSADITFYVEQARNNSGFVCPALPTPKL